MIERNEQACESHEYPLMSFVQSVGVMPKGERYDRSFLVRDNSKKYKKTEFGDFIYSSNNLDTGSIGLNKTGKAVISPVYSIFRSTNIINSQFVGVLCNTRWFINKMIKYRQGVVYGQWRIHESEFLNIKIVMPSLKERKKIVTLLTSIDLIITLHQRKLENLKLKKKALLQKLFPKNGECYPELRFPGFTDAWEQRKLGSIAIINPKSELPEQFKYIDLESVVGTSLLGYSVVERENAPSRAQRLAIEGDVFYQTVRPYQRNNYLYEETDQDYVFSTGYAQLRTSLDSYFLLTLLQNDNFVKIVLDNCTGTSYPAINSSSLAKIPISTPKSIDETIKIGNIFRKLDKFITLHQ